MIENKEKYINILPEGRQQSRLSILFGLVKRDIRLFRFAQGKKYNLFLGTDPSLSHVGFLLRIPVITVLEDDIEVIPSLAKLTYPFTTHILTPASVRVGKYVSKKIPYEGYMKLAYLHPKYFTASSVNIEKPYSLLRLSQLNAHHDFGIKGINEALLDQVIGNLSKYGRVFISSEKPLLQKYNSYQLNINPSEMHQYLANAQILISDSQSMSMEAAMLGVPSIRFSDFAGKISVLEELEHKYKLTFGIPANEPQRLLDKINELISQTNLLKEFQSRRNSMLSEKIDVSAFMVWLIDNYPNSLKTLREYPDYQSRFK
jgi:hypothetical protein